VKANDRTEYRYQLIKGDTSRCGNDVDDNITRKIIAKELARHTMQGKYWYLNVYTLSFSVVIFVLKQRGNAAWA